MRRQRLGRQKSIAEGDDMDTNSSAGLKGRRGSTVMAAGAEGMVTVNLRSIMESKVSIEALLPPPKLPEHNARIGTDAASVVSAEEPRAIAARTEEWLIERRKEREQIVSRASPSRGRGKGAGKGLFSKGATSQPSTAAAAAKRGANLVAPGTAGVTDRPGTAVARQPPGRPGLMGTRPSTAVAPAPPASSRLSAVASPRTSAIAGTRK